MLFLQDTTEEQPEETPEEPPEEQPSKAPQPKRKKRKTTTERLDEEKVAKKLEGSIMDDGEDVETPQDNDLENGEMDTKEKCQRRYELFEKAIEKHQRKIIFLASEQGEVLSKLKDLCAKEGRRIEFLTQLNKLEINESTAKMKIRIAELTEEFPKLKKTNLSLHFFNKYMNQIRAICEKSGEKYM